MPEPLQLHCEHFLRHSNVPCGEIRLWDNTAAPKKCPDHLLALKMGLPKCIAPFLLWQAEYDKLLKSLGLQQQHIDR